HEFDWFSTLGFLFNVVSAERIPRRQNRASAISKQHLDAFVRQHLNNHVRAGHDLAGKRVVTFTRPSAPTFPRRPRAAPPSRGHRSSRAPATATTGAVFCFGFCRNAIISRSCLPTTSIGRPASVSRIFLKFGRPASFSAIHCFANVPS